MKKILALFSPLALLAAPSASAEFSFVEKENSLELLDDGKIVTAFRSDHRVPYLYPIVSPSGANITRHWPMNEEHKSEERDHPHHRGLWLAHGNVNGVDFWHADENTSITVKSVTKSAEADTATISADLLWTSGGKNFLSEIRTFIFTKPDADTLRVDITSNSTALLDEVVFGDTKEGTFALRMDRTLRVKGPEAKAKLVNSEGDTDGETWGKRAAWTATYGPDELGKPVVIAILDDPKSFRHPTHWHARDYGLLAANPFGIHDFEKNPDKNIGSHTLKKGETLALKYTLIVHHGTLETAKLATVKP